MKRLPPRALEPGERAGQFLSTKGGITTWADPPQSTPLRFDYSAGTQADIDTSAGHQAFPAALTMASGRHLIAYRSGVDHNYDTTAKVLARTADADGDNWSGPVTAFDTAKDEWASGGLAQLNDGKVLLFAAVRGGVTVDAGWYSAVVPSLDEGATWGAPVTVDGGYSAQEIGSDIAVLPNGEVVAVFYGRDSGGSFDYAAASVSTDQGATWVRRSIIKKSATEHFQEPCLVVMPDGEILCFLRYLSGTTNRIYLARSTDAAATWSAPVVILENASGQPRAHRTPDGQLAVTFRDMTSPYNVPGWAISRDNGATWEKRPDWTGANRRFVYAGWLDLSNGDLGIVYGLESMSASANDADIHMAAFPRVLTEPVSPGSLATTGATEGDTLVLTGGVFTPGRVPVTRAHMPLTTVVAGVPELVWDDNDSLIPTEVPL